MAGSELAHQGVSRGDRQQDTVTRRSDILTWSAGPKTTKPPSPQGWPWEAIVLGAGTSPLVSSPTAQDQNRQAKFQLTREHRWRILSINYFIKIKDKPSSALIPAPLSSRPDHCLNVIKAIFSLLFLLPAKAGILAGKKVKYMVTWTFHLTKGRASKGRGKLLG